MHQAAELLHAFDTLAVVFEHNISGFQSSFFSRAAICDAGDFDAVGFLELQLARAINADLSQVDAQIRATGQQAPIAELENLRRARVGLSELHQLYLLSAERGREQGRQRNEFMHTKSPLKSYLSRRK